MDIAVGAFDDISSAAAPGVGEALRRAMPGLVEHRCSIGERGGFLTRLRRGTYAPHIIEHVALELQSMAGHDVGYGKTRGGDVPGEYTLVFEHRHAGVGVRAAALALDVVQRAFAGTLDGVEHAVSELRALADSPDAPPVRQRVLCGITGGALRRETREALARIGIGGEADEELVVDVAPSYVLQAGLPYSRSRLAIILDAEPVDVPERYRDPERARTLVSVLADATRRDGVVIAPAREWEVQDYARDAGSRVAIFSADGAVTAKDQKVASAVATAGGGRIIVETGGDPHDAGALADDLPVAPQLAAALARWALREGVRGE
jgi:cyanophycin synthetase